MDGPPLVAFSHPWLAYLFYFAAAWVLVWGVYWSLRATGRVGTWPWHRVLGAVLVAWPFVRYINLVYEDFQVVLDTNSVAATVPAWAWWNSIIRRSWQYVLMPLVGLFLVFGHHLPRPRLAGFGRRLYDTLRRVDSVPRKGTTRTIVDGLGLFVIVFIAYIGLFQLLSPLQRFDTGDESAVFNGLTPALAIVLAITAGVTEEFLFRGVLQTRLARVMPLGVAIVIQAIGFGLIHSGYGTIGHIVFPIFFGLAMGILAIWFGVLPLIIVHALIDLVLFFATTAENGYAWTEQAIPVVFVVAVVVPGTYWTMRLWRFLTRPRRGLPDPGGDRRTGPSSLPSPETAQRNP